MDSEIRPLKRANEWGLTEKQEIFAQHVAKGSTLIDAYKAAYDWSSMKQASMYSEASKLMDDPRIAQRVRHLMEQRAKRTHALDVMRIRQHVFDRLMVESVDEDNPAASRVRALELLGKIDVVSMWREPKEGPPPTEESVADLQGKLRDMLAKLVDVTPIVSGTKATEDDNDGPRSGQEAEDE